MRELYNGSQKQLIAIIQKAKKDHLWNGKGEYHLTHKQRPACFALSSASRILYGVSRPQELNDLVRRHIGRHAYMEDFLRKKFGARITDKGTSEQVQGWRFLMLDNMIKIIKEERIGKWPSTKS
jgi:hypothetical protein